MEQLCLAETCQAKDIIVGGQAVVVLLDTWQGIKGGLSALWQDITGSMQSLQGSDRQMGLITA